MFLCASVARIFYALAVGLVALNAMALNNPNNNLFMLPPSPLCPREHYCSPDSVLDL